jgi:membrane-associated phospholipid phosphatase
MSSQTAMTRACFSATIDAMNDTSTDFRADRKRFIDTTNRPLYITGLIVGILLFLPSLYLARKHQLVGFQARIFYDFNNLPGWYTKPALYLTEALGAGYAIAACIIVPLLFKRFRLAWRFLVTVGGTGVVMEAAKLVAKEPRPAALLQGHLHIRAVETGLNSFPSGHAAVATAMALTLWLILPRAWRWVSIVWIVVVGLSRLYLGVHTATDIIGGFAIGLAVVSAVQLLPGSIARPLHLDNKEPLLKRGF